jgi:hypothetical protein
MHCFLDGTRHIPDFDNMHPPAAGDDHTARKAAHDLESFRILGLAGTFRQELERSATEKVRERCLFNLSALKCTVFLEQCP